MKLALSTILSCLAVIFLFTSPLVSQDSDDEKLIFSHKRGYYESNFDLTLSTTTPGLTIKYTKDGTDPLTSSTAWSGESPVKIHVDPASVDGRDKAPGFFVSAVAIEGGKAVTKVKTHTYLFTNRVVELMPDNQRPGPKWLAQNMSGSSQNINYGMDPTVCNSSLYRTKIEQALKDIPTMSMVIDLEHLFDSQTGIYTHAYNRGPEWERPCSLELLPHEGMDDFQINAGVRIRGGYSRDGSNPKHAFRYFFRNEYGESKLRYPLFGDEGVDEFDKIDLRTSQNYSWSFDGSQLNTMNRDVFSRDTQREMGQPYTRSRYYHLYINGIYWGLFQTQERSEANFAESYFGGDKDQYDVIKVAPDQGYIIEATDGNLDAYERLWNICNEGFQSDANYFKVLGKNPDGTDNPEYEILVDEDNLIDYLLCGYVTGDYDAPVSNFINNNGRPNNYYAIFNRVNPDGFKFFRHDSEHTMRDHNWAYDRTGPFPAGSQFLHFNPQWLHQQLVENMHYRTRLADRINKYFFNSGVLTPEANIARFMSRIEEIDLAIIAESARWGDSKREPAYTRDNAWIPAYKWIIDDFFPNRTNIVLNQLKAKGWFPQTSPPEFNVTDARVNKGFQLQMTSSTGKIYYTTDGTDPYQPSSSTSNYVTLVSENAVKRVFVPTEYIGWNWVRIVNYDDSAWKSGTGGVGYERGDGYQNYIRIDISSDMVDRQTSCFVRIPFTIDQSQLETINMLKLNLRYDDGFIAYLNGKKVAEAMAPESIQWNSTATENHEAESWESFVISDYVDQLNVGDNLLAIHGLNVSTTSSDFIISAELVAANVSNLGLISASAMEYTAPLVVDNSMNVKARVLNSNDWSAAGEVKLYVLEGTDNLKISEIHYHPLDSGAGEDDDGDYEFIELKNVGGEAIDVSGMSLSRGIRYTFPAGTLMEGGQLVVLAANDTMFAKRYGFKPFGVYVGQLDNGGETIAFNNADGDTLIKIRYNDKYPWPASADGEGYSIIPKEQNPYKDQNDPTNWMRSTYINGSPGENDLSLDSPVQNEPEPVSFNLLQNFPNPFNPTTTICFSVARQAHVSLKIYNLLGQHVETLSEKQFSPGAHQIVWNAGKYSGGIYFCRLEAQGKSQVRKLLLVK